MKSDTDFILSDVRLSQLSDIFQIHQFFRDQLRQKLAGIFNFIRLRFLSRNIFFVKQHFPDKAAKWLCKYIVKKEAAKSAYFYSYRFLYFVLTVLLLILTTSDCSATCPESKNRENYLDLYDRVVNLYYKPPYKKKEALELLKQGCNCPSSHQDMSCHNLGVLYELRGELKLASHSYAKANTIRPDMWFELAQERTGNIRHQASQNQKYIQSIIQACNSKDANKAIARLDQWINNTAPANLPEKALLQQPFFTACMQHEPQFASLLKQLKVSGISNKRFTQKYYQELGKLHPLHSIFDIELYLQHALLQTQSRRKVTAEWQNILFATRKGQGKKAALAIHSMFLALNQSARKSGYEARKVKAMKRAVSVLIDRDPWFRKIRQNPDVRKRISKHLK